MKRGSFRSIDWLTYGYVLFNMVLIFFGRNRVPEAAKHLGILTLIAILLYILIRLYNEKSGWVLTFLRLWYPFILFTYFFELSTIANRVFFPDYIDPFFIRIDQFIFGYQPVELWGQMINNFFLRELLYMAYFSYYLVIPGVAFLLYLTKRELFERYAFTISFVFFVCYFTYTFLPVIGGRYLPGIPELTTAYQGGPFQHIMAFIYITSDHWGSAFPSSHVAVTVAVNIAALQYFKKLGYYLLPLTILLSFSTIYCHYHYFIDTVFGLFYGVGFYFAGIAVFDRSKKNRVAK